jgi:hypothetical protein
VECREDECRSAIQKEVVMAKKRKKSTLYRNKIDAILGIIVKDVEDLKLSSHISKQKHRQRTRWLAHLERKASDA